MESTKKAQSMKNEGKKAVSILEQNKGGHVHCKLDRVSQTVRTNLIIIINKLVSEIASGYLTLYRL
jgi:hypothetical protein